MPLQPPNLDDRRFAELFAELRSLIPRYAPEWTDHNLSDPGITMMQLFSWLGEIVLFRLNRVPDRNYLKFLQLIGVEQKPAVPAKAELTFTLVSPSPATVFIPRGTQIAAVVQPLPPSALAIPTLPPEPEEPVIFETDEPLIAIGATLQTVLIFNGTSFIDYTQANKFPQQRYPAFGSSPRDGNALLLGFASDNPFPSVEMNLFVRVFIEPNTAQEHRCDLPENEIHPSATIAWEYWNGSDWSKLSLLKDETRALTQSGHVYVRTPKPPGIQKRIFGSISEPLYWIRCHLVKSQYENPPELDAVLTNTVRATAVTTVKDQVLGSSDGLPNQSLSLLHSPIFASSVRPVEERLQEQNRRTPNPNEAERILWDKQLQQQELIKGFLLEIDEGQEAQPWEEVEDFFNSSAGDRHYLLNRTIGEITFGNGERGRIPLAGINNIVVRYYRYGGGTNSNVAPGMIASLQTSADGVDTVTNYWAAEGGDDEEAIALTKARAPKELKARDRAVTNQDFEFLAQQTPGVRVRRAYALPLYHPQFPDTLIPGAITVIVIPESKEPKPIPSEGTMQTVCAYLNRHRLLTTEVFVAPPKYLQVKVEARILTRPSANPAVVKTQIEQVLNSYLHPLTGGEDGLGWPLGGEVIHSEVFRRVLTVNGVQRIDDLRIVIDGDRLLPCTNASIPKNFLVFSDGHDIDVTFSTEA
ncbi:MAG: putative baseplate assembly protein [Nostoc sp.]|uniref:putative baseplate assembly protein n=1 Tax=Nostoc sp. TaxID=1180 RepID=UPI002FF4A5E7